MQAFVPGIFMFAAQDAVPTILLLLGVVAILVWVFARKIRKKRIVIHPKEKVILYAQGKQNCPACRTPFDGLPVVRCKRDSSHVIHAVCKEMVKGRCPDCNGQIE